MGAEGEFARVRENLERGLELSGQPVKRGTMAHEHDVYAMLTDIAARQRDVVAIQRFAPRAQELALRDSHRLYLPIVDRAWGVVRRLAGEYVEAETRLNAALESFRQIGAHWQTGRTLSELGELALARSNGGAARDYFSQALTDFDTMSAVPDAERARATLNTLN